MFHSYLPLIWRVRPDRAGVTPPLGGRLPASFGPLCRISSIVQSRRLSRGVLRPPSRWLSREESSEEPDREFRILQAEQQVRQFAGLVTGLLTGESGSLWPELQSRQQSGLRRGLLPDPPADLFPTCRLRGAVS